MEWLFLLGLSVLVGWLWQRLKLAEHQLEAISYAQHAAADQIADLVRGLEREPALAEDEELVMPEAPPVPEAAISVPKVVSEPAAMEGDTEPPQEVWSDGAHEEQRASSLRIDFEDIFGRRLPIWAGGVALAVAGVFLVRYSIEAGLLTPPVRVAMAFLFGLLLLAGAETAYRFEERVSDERVRQALAGAGLATLYAAFYLAGSWYGLIGQSVAFIGLASVTAAAIALSFRFGLPSAVLGLVGGFAAPALVGSDEANLPLLSLYLALVAAGLTLSGRHQRRPWMGMGAMFCGLGWGGLLVVSGDFAVADLLALGLYLVVLGSMIPSLAGAQTFEKPLRIVSAGVASVELAVLVAQGGYSALTWGLYLILAAALAVFGWRRPDLRGANALVAVVALILLALWNSSDAVLFSAVAAGLALVFAGVPLALTFRGEAREVDLALLAGVPTILGAIALGTFGGFEDDAARPILAAALALLAGLPLAGRWAGRDGEREWTFAAQPASAGLLLFPALLMLTPAWLAPLMAGLVFVAVLVLLRNEHDRWSRAALWGFAVLALGALAATQGFPDELARLWRFEGGAASSTSLLRWLPVLGAFALLAWNERDEPRRHLADGLGAAFAYGALAQVVPGLALAWLAAAMAVATHRMLPRRMVASFVLAAIACLWALAPLADWAAAMTASLVGDPVFVVDIPTPLSALLRLVPAALCLALMPLPAMPGRRLPAYIAPAALGTISAHIFWKQVFAIGTAEQFVARGMAERTIWEALLLAACFAALRGLRDKGAARIAAGIGAGAALAHFALYTALLHDPLFVPQAVGGVPLANLFLAAGGVAAASALRLRTLCDARWRPWLDGLAIAIVSFTAIGLLRQAFAGSVPVLVPLDQTEDLLRSLTGIVLAAAFLAIGSRVGERSWRVGSLALMLVAVAKVFLFDAAGLEGLLRIASFMALGFSLIGIGWFYSRQLRASEDAPTPDTAGA